ncbi:MULTISPECIES: molybdopterin-dependent oxidoreductase [Bacillus]|uniref:Molybdopterin oxidoreductase family protein n=2 Tax=Bacillus TaxID=1386 RepID=A0AAJ3YYS4_9BACI|nr:MULTISPECIES: molybdopterin oxidoreductase family protein [Bacillus]KKB73645.1 oxidoreductase [Bacillus sp. TH008]MDU0073731.1 molybdopterin oxidoreductase family protein [Bacillus sp. IG6]MED8021625.1 molybdopterin oxidoreductase family protein [Bacillus glycinifermentans]QAT65586.1 molybdopterin oxidoreductase family protein [Bacillus glycinifermentans]WKB75279.1 molybdopterin oxidoreductase family protein [Bacillus glycinifermentans]
MESYVHQKNGIFKSVCSLDCPDQCGLLVHKKDGKIVKIQGDPDHPVTQGNICNKVRNMTERIYDPKRLKTPLKRTGPKGSGTFEPISWDEAIDTIRTRWTELIEKEGPESILPYSFYGNMGNLTAEGMDRRFFHRLGSSQLERAICTPAGSVGYQYTMGGSIGTDPEDTTETKLFIFWGINAVSTNMHQITIAQKARKNGAKIVVIDVHKNQTGRMADWFIPILPGTDSALALGIMHVLFAEGMADEAFLKKYTVGHEELRRHVLQYDPDTVAEITGVPREDIVELARLYGKTSPSLIRIGNGLQHHDNGGMIVRTIACLPAITGQWTVKGGGAIKGNTAFLAYNTKALQRPDLLNGRTPRVINMNQLGKALLEIDPPIRSLFVYSSNPAVVAPEANKVRKGLEREDLFTVVHDLFLTETARYADIVLPASSAFENMDFYTSYWHHYTQLQRPVIEKYGMSKSNTEVFRLLAEAMGFDDEPLKDSDEEMIRQALDYPANPWLDGIDFDSLSEKHFVKAKRETIFPERLPTPSGKIELYSKKMEQDGYPALPTHTPLLETGEYPFLFVPGPNHNFLNTTFSNNEKHIKLEKEPKLHINIKDAEEKGIENGDSVKIRNDRGECILTAAVGENVLPGVVVSQGLWADKDGKNYLVNALTPDRLSDMGGGATFFSGRVQIEKMD